MSLRLIIEDDEGSTTVVPLASDAITIGRQQGNTIQLTEKNVSRQHARLYPESDGWIIEDLGSYNGIKVNNDAVDGRTKLREGDVVEIGDYHLAITEDVDKSPLNFRTGQAANDGVVEPMLVSSSADLPRLSPEEIAALQSGQQPIAPPPRGVPLDSGPVPASQYRGAAYGEPERRSKTGLFIILGLVLLGVFALGIFWILSANKGDDSGEVAKGKTDAGKTDAGKAALPQPKSPAADDGAAAADAGADAGAVADDAGAADDGGVVADDGAADGGDDPVEIIEDDPVTKPKSNKPKSNKPKSNKPKTNVDVDALMSEARDKQFRDPASSYRLAKQAYGAKTSTAALWVMGPAACRMKDRSKAVWVLRRLKGSDKQRLKDICAGKGIEL